MFTRAPGALARALLIAMLVSMPAILLPGTPSDTGQLAALLALAAAVFTFIEYIARAPSLVEFRDAPPFNRIRFASLFGTVLVLCLILGGQSNPSSLSDLLSILGARMAELVDFPYSPVRLMLVALPDTAAPSAIENVRIAAGISYLVSIVALWVFIFYIRILGWPVPRGGFNVWINLPTFDPTNGGDVVARLQKDATVNLVLGFLLPFIIPAAFRIVSALAEPITLEAPHTLIWTMAAWAFLPASLLMRGIALNRVAQMISAERARALARDGGPVMATA